MNAKKMLARYAQGGMVDEIGELRANMGGDISDARRMLQNLSSPVRHFANGGTLTPEEMQEESRKASRSQRDIEELQAIGLFDPARVPAAGKLTAEGEQLAKDRLAFWTSNKPDYVQNFGGAAALLNSIREDLATDPAGRYTPKAAPPPAPVKDTGATDKKDTGPLTTLVTSPVTTLTTSPITTLATSSVTTNPPIILPPTTALPPLQETFVAPTAPLPEAPPVALTAGQEGLDPSTAIVKAIPQSERVAIPQLDTEFRASEPRTPTYDRFGRITGYTYSPAAKLTPATGTNVFNFVPPGITSRPRSLLNLGDVPGVMVDPVTGQMRLPLSASQQFARDRSTLDNQFRQLYARAAAGDKSIPAQAPASAAAAFRNFVMSGEDPMLQNKLRFRDIEQQKYDPTKADPALRAQYGQSAFVSDLAAAFDPFLARNRAALTSLAEQQAPKSYSEQYPDIAAAYAKLSEADKAKFPTLRDYELYHFDTYGRKEGRTSPLLGMGALQSPYAATFFSKGGEASTEDFIKKQSGGDVSRETASPNTAEVPKLTSEGQLIDEREEIRSESQRMLNRLQSQPSKLPPGIRRTVAATREQGKESMFPAAAPARDLLSGILGASPTAPGSEAYRTGQAIANMPPVQAAAAIPAKIAASAGDAATALAAMGPAVGAVVKRKGGNWLTGGDERGLKALAELMPGGPRNRDEALALGNVYARLVDQPVGIKQMARDDAISNWIETKLSKYVKNEMATPEDPVRALAERGITLQGVNPAQLDKHLAFERELAGYPKEGIARTPEGKAWEAAADRAIVTEEAGALLDDTQYGSMVKNRKRMYPWLENLDPQTPVYRMSSRFSDRFESTGFRHLIDELTNAINPDSGLPRSLQLSPDKLQKVTVPQAVELVDKINKWRAEQKVAADLKRSQNAATVEYKAYDTIPGTAEPNQRGLRWVELRAPTEGLALPKGYSIQTSHNTPYLRDEKGQVVQYLDDANGVDAAAKKVVGRMSLEDALKYEGETMGHCVGGYCPDVEEGRSRIYSLRDAKGEPHVTIEVSPGAMSPSEFYHSDLATQSLFDRLDKVDEATINRDKPSWWEEVVRESPEYQEYLKTIPPKITQIKGKANRAPKDEYLPFVQDFVRSGQWSAVGDIRNTGLIEIDPSSDLARNIRAAGGEPPKFVTQQELTEWLNWWRLRQYGDPTNGFKKGGEVTIDDFINQSLTDGERKQNIKLDSVQSLQDFLQSLPKGPPSPQPVEPDNVLPDVALKRKGAKELESYINALNPRAQVFDVPEGYQSSYRSSPFGLKGSGLVGSVPIREPDRINVLNTLTPGQRERVLLHEAEHSMSLRGGDIQGELDSKGRPIIMDNAFRAVALLKGNELPVREFVKNVALNKDKIDAFFGEPSFGSEFKKQSYEELRKRGRELALFEEQLASLSALEQATGRFLTQDKEMRKLLFPNTEMMAIFDALTGPRQTRMDARDLPPHTPMNPMSYETGNAISRFIAEKTRKPLLRELPEAKMRVK